MDRSSLKLRNIERVIHCNINLNTRFKLHVNILNEGHSRKGNITDPLMRIVRLQWQTACFEGTYIGIIDDMIVIIK